MLFYKRFRIMREKSKIDVISEKAIDRIRERSYLQSEMDRKLSIYDKAYIFLL